VGIWFLKKKDSTYLNHSNSWHRVHKGDSIWCIFLFLCGILIQSSKRQSIHFDRALNWWYYDDMLNLVVFWGKFLHFLWENLLQMLTLRLLSSILQKEPTNDCWDEELLDFNNKLAKFVKKKHTHTHNKNKFLW